MAIQATIPPPASAGDPDESMGQALMAHERREGMIYTIKIVIVWICLFGILSLFLVSLDFDPAYMLDHFRFVLAGAGLTILISLISVTIAAVLALFGALGRLSRNPIAQGITGFYVSIVRGTPLLIQIYIIYLGLPQIGNQFRIAWLSGSGRSIYFDSLAIRHFSFEPQLWRVYDRNFSGWLTIYPSWAA